MKNKALNAAVIRYILALLLMGALLLTSFISVNALEWNGDSSTGSMIGRPAVSNSFYILNSADDISDILVAWRFTYYDKYGNLTYAGKAGDGVSYVEIWLNNSYKNYAQTYYASAQMHSVYPKLSKKAYADAAAAGSFVPSGTNLNTIARDQSDARKGCWPEYSPWFSEISGGKTFASALPCKPSEIGAWCLNPINSDIIAKALGCSGGTKAMAAGDKIVVEPVFWQQLNSEWVAATPSEFASIGALYCGLDSNGLIKNSAGTTDGTWGFTCQYTNLYYPTSLYMEDGMGLWDNVVPKDTNQDWWLQLLTMREIMQNGFGVGVAFSIKDDAPTNYYLDVNGALDGTVYGDLSNYGTCDVYINGTRVADDVTDYYASWPYGTTYEITDIKSTTGHTYNGVYSGSLSGTIAGSTATALNFTTNIVHIAYHPNGGTVSASGYGYNQYGWVTQNGATWFDSITYGNSSDPYNATTFGLTRTGYTFVGWRVESTGQVLGQDTVYDSTVYADYSNGSATTANTSTVHCYLYAVWEPIPFKVTYNANGGSGTVASQSVNYDSSITIRQNGFSRRGYNFLGWSTKTDNTDDGYGWTPGWTGTWKYLNGQYGIANNTLNLYARWAPMSYTIEYKPNGGSGTMDDQTFEFDSNVTIKGNGFTAPAGYKFAGWTTKADGTDDGYNWTGWSGKWAYTNGDYGVANNKLTLYARWTPNTYTVTVNKGTGISNVRVYDSNIGIWRYQAGDALYTLFGRNYYKTNGGEALFTTISSNLGSANCYYGPLLVSKDPNAVVYSTSGDYTHTDICAGSVTYNGEVWYYSGSGAWFVSEPVSGVPYLNAMTGVSAYSSLEESALSLLEAYYSSGTTQRVVPFGTSVTIEATVSLGYSWSKWTGTHSTTTQKYTFTMPAGNVTDTANATANPNTPYKVQHWQQKVDGGSEQNRTNFTLVETQNLTGTTGASVTPAVKSYTGFDSPSTKTVIIAADGRTVVNYYYTRRSYPVTVNKGTGISSVSGGGTYRYGASVTIDATVSLGYTWRKWSGTYDSTTKAYTFTMPASHVVVTANAAANPYTIVYDGNGATGGSTASSTHTYDVPKELTANGYTRTGYIFTGWNTEADGSGTAYDDQASVVNLTATNGGTVTLYAQWESAGVPPLLTPIPANAPYREGTEVITSFRLSSFSATFTASNALPVRFCVYNADTDELLYTVQKDIVCPADEEQLCYFKWQVPTLQGADGFRVTAEYFYADQWQGLATGEYDYCPWEVTFTPDTKYEVRSPSGWLQPVQPSNQTGSMTWMEWICDSNGNFTSVQYGIDAVAPRTEIVPYSRTAYKQFGDWYFKSGYGFTISAAGSTLRAADGCSMPASDAYTDCQYAYLQFPEFRYASDTDCVSTLEKVGNTWQLYQFLHYGRIHFTPLWYPDGPYYCKLVQTDIWTPMGAITVSRPTDKAVISGDLYDDWFTRS